MPLRKFRSIEEMNEADRQRLEMISTDLAVADRSRHRKKDGVRVHRHILYQGL